jgi:hypothetical protein
LLQRSIFLKFLNFAKPKSKKIIEIFKREFFEHKDIDLITKHDVKELEHEKK